MTTITTKKTIDVVTGLICDRCGHIDEDGFNDLHVNHTFGFGTELDTTTVSFSLCDLCLTDIILNKIPHAKFRSNAGKPIKVEKTEDGFAIIEKI